MPQAGASCSTPDRRPPLGGNVSRCWRWFEFGIGARYDFAHAGDNAHFIVVPLWIGARFPLGATGTLRLTAGAGPGFGFVAGYPRGSTFLRAGVTWW